MGVFLCFDGWEGVVVKVATMQAVTIVESDDKVAETGLPVLGSWGLCCHKLM